MLILLTIDHLMTFALTSLSMKRGPLRHHVKIVQRRDSRVKELSLDDRLCKVRKGPLVESGFWSLVCCRTLHQMMAENGLGKSYPEGGAKRAMKKESPRAAQKARREHGAGAGEERPR